MSRTPELSTTGYAILGMLAVNSLTRHELAKRFDNSLGRFWPRARSKLYEGPRRLVDLGLATAAPARTGRRASTVYAITPAGRDALREWLGQPGQGPSIEFEQLLKVFFAEHGGTESVRVNLGAAQDWVARDLQEHLRVARLLLEGRSPSQERLPQLVLTGTFLSEFALLVARWADWAQEVVAGWPADPAQAEPDRRALRELVGRLELAVERITRARRQADDRGR